MTLLDRAFNSSSSCNIALENGIGSSPLWLQATGLYVMMLFSERVNFQVSRRRSFVRVPKPLRTAARSVIEVALYVRLYSPNVDRMRDSSDSHHTCRGDTLPAWSFTV